MWYLTSVTGDPRVIYVLPQSSIITIGRNIDSPNSFTIQDDSSISRKHAALSVNTENNLFIQDMGSRYGTYINDTEDKIEENVMIKIITNDTIKFGKLNCVWKVHYISFTTCTSTVTEENLQSLKLTVAKLGGSLKSEWDNTCAYLTMPAITLTIKVVLALAQGSHIVTIDFWIKALEAVNTQTPLPDPNKYTPKVLESTLNKENVSFLPDVRRSKLFSGKKIVFFSKKQYEMYKTVLDKTSATALLINTSKMTKNELCDSDVILIQYISTNVTQETQNQKNQFEDIANYLKSKGKRVVSDAEIGLAVLYCSTKKYCNTKLNYLNEVVKQTNEQNKETTVIAQETQESTTTFKRENVVINETLTSKHDLSVDKGITSKRKLSDDNELQTNAIKKIAMGSKIEISSETSKRKTIDDDNIGTNSTKKLAIANDFSDGDECFNFTKSVSTNNDKENKSKGNTLFSKPLKRKALKLNEGEDELFNFVQDKSKDVSNGENIHEQKRQCLFGINKEQEVFEEDEEGPVVNKKIYDINSEEISAMRGIKLKELMENISNTTYNSEIPTKNIKREDTDDLNAKFNDIDLGTTIIKVRSDLIVKKDPVQVADQPIQTKNFKQFKKVWPIKMQMTMINKSSISHTVTTNAPELSFQASTLN